MGEQTQGFEHEIDSQMLRAYLLENMSVAEMARVEKALRESAQLRAMLEEARAFNADASLHSLGEIWMRARLTCPSRQRLGNYLLDTLDSEEAGYVTFHLETVECTLCRANLEDLKRQSEQASAIVKARHRRYFHSSRHLLSGDSSG